MAVSRFENSKACLTFFEQRIVHMIEHWRDHHAVQRVEVAVLDHKREAILRAITLGLDFAPAWPLVRPLIIAFTDYMERRGYWDAWHSLLEQAIGVARRLEDVEGETTLTALLARLYQRMSRPDQVVRTYRRVIRLARRTGNRFEEARASSNLGYLYIDGYIDGRRWWRSEVLSLHALAIFEELESDHGLAHTHNHLGLLYARAQRWDEARTNLEAACAIWAQRCDDHSLIFGYMNLGLLEIELEAPDPALAHLEKAYTIAHQSGERSNIAKIANNMAAAHRQKRDWAEAERCAREAEQIFQEFADEQGLADVWKNLGIIYSHSAQERQALWYFGESLRMFRKLGNQTAATDLIRTATKLAAPIDKIEAATPPFKRTQASF